MLVIGSIIFCCVGARVDANMRIRKFEKEQKKMTKKIDKQNANILNQMGAQQ